MTESYPFTMYSGLLEPEHYKRIGSAIWLFLWCISSTTKEIERDGVTWGIVLGNKPLKRKDLAEPFGVSERTVQRWLDDLEKNEYLKVTRVPYGYILTVRKSKKYRVGKNVHSKREETKVSTLEWTKVSSHVDKSVHSNKDITKINTTTKKDSVDIIAEKYSDLRTIQEGKKVYPKTSDYQAIARIVAQGVPTSQTIKLLEQCFADFEEDRRTGERSPNDRINSFKYCEKYIADKWETRKEKEKAKAGKVVDIKSKHKPNEPQGRYVPSDFVLDINAGEDW